MITDVKELYEMDDYDFNREIAELDGWTGIWEASLGGGGRVLRGTRPNGDADFIPSYATDLNAAWALIPIQRSVNVWRHAETPTVTASISRIDGSNAFVECDTAPARALATAWAAWKLEQEE